ncbi:PIN domain-containing protein [Saccharococcus caldoxylosilyticus]|uniref:PIN domain-containing protein n=1 Tax=Saccharococcus caldoxylosilyticus TaxID=81408 RepID=UPI00035CB171|nr:PIN domain-containing protein [Parageobacillus caldoxylosilyticus]
MTIAVFLDTNILMKDFKMNSYEFERLFDAYEEYSERETFKLMITEMTKHEIIKNYEKKLNEAYNSLNEYFQKAKKILLESESIPTKREWKTKHLDLYESNLLDRFEVYIPDDDVYSKATKRYYEKKYPFRDNKEEFKDAIIWETIYDYANNFSDEMIYFISENHKDYAIKDDEGNYKLHPHFDDMNGRIKYFQNLKDFLKEIEYLKIYHFDFREKEEILSIVEDYLQNYANSDDAIDMEMYRYFSNGVFQSDFIEGWGTDYYISEIYEVNIDTDEDVLEDNGYFIIPIIFEAEIEYAVETKNPLYEPGDDEFIQSETISEDFVIKCNVVFDAVGNQVERLTDVEICSV